MSEQQPGWERNLLEKLALASLEEQKRNRHWKIFFRLIWLLIVVVILFSMIFGQSSDNNSGFPAGGPHTAVVDLSGVIESQQDNAGKLIEGMEAAYRDKNTRAIIIRANSPGGSPVLSGQAFDEIRRLRKLHAQIPVYAVVEEVCASGCYYIAAAADRIYVDQASLIGSIGVLSDGFGFVGSMEKLGIERRLMTSGSNKGMGDPFSPANPEQQAILQTMLDQIHQQFITAVKQGRGKRLRNDPELFSGRIYLGTQGNQLGLSDALGSVRSVARNVVKAEKIKDFTPKEDLGQRLGQIFGVSFGAALRSSLFDSHLM